jgi:hypothetical protein
MPRTKGIVYQGSLSAVTPSASTGTMWGSWSWAASRISLATRSALSAAASSGESTFATTWRSRRVSVATNTRAMSPPSSRSRV